MAKKLVIVESPAKAKTIGKLLGKGYNVKASIGHIRDLPKSKLGVDIDNEFTPQYVIPRDRKKIIKELKDAAKEASAIYLATDPDREGEAISWHLTMAVPFEGKSIHRVIFHELTDKAINTAFHNPTVIDMNKVNAQQARRILDRLVGYKISPLLWQKVRRGLSAGRVQSVALRMIVEREREIGNFTPEEFWTIDALLKKPGAEPQFIAKLNGFVDKKKKLIIHNKEESDKLIAELRISQYSVVSVNSKTVLRQPYPPFITSTLQQEAWQKLRFTAQRTMRIAQQLYEGLAIGDGQITGLITYMRTDSTRIDPAEISEARDYVKERYGTEFIPVNPRHFVRKIKGAQEAHEAIRPTSIRREPDSLKKYLTVDQYKLYELIWKKVLASQMSAASFRVLTVDIEAKSRDIKNNYLLRASSSTLTFKGFLILSGETKEDVEGIDSSKLPDLLKNDTLELKDLVPEQHFTQPPPRYTEATLIKALEDNGIGRPSTYASIVSVIQEREYVSKKEGRLHPAEIGMVISDLLTQNFPDTINVGFTAEMEEELDKVARGEIDWISILQGFYPSFADTLEKAKSNVQKIKLADEETGEVCPNCGKPMVIKMGRFGKFVACSGYPECKTTKPLVKKTGVKCPECEGELVERQSKKGRKFYGCSNYPACDFIINKKPLATACPQCGAIMVVQGTKMAKCTKCDYKMKLENTEAVS